MTQKLLSIQHLYIDFPSPSGIVKAVRNVEFDIGEGEKVGLVGESGCGKTTIALSILGLIPEPGKITSGQILLEGQNIVEMSPGDLQDLRGNRVAMIYQDPMTSLNPSLRIGTQIEEAMLVHRFKSLRQARDHSIDLLTQVEVPEPKHRSRNYPHQFSGGMRQRSVIAMGLANTPSLLLADEPTTALDVTVQAQIISLLQMLNTEYKMAILLITHNIALVSNLCDRLLVMYAGQIVESGPTRQIIDSPQHPYTWMLMQAIPRLDLERGKQLINIEGAPPELDHLPTGCSFHPRCPYVIPLCIDCEPTPTDVDKDHFARCWVTMRNVPPKTNPPQTKSKEKKNHVYDKQILLEVSNVSKKYLIKTPLHRARILKAVDEVSLTINQGETLGLVGESGSGKSTLARIILLLERPESGSIYFLNQNLSTMSNEALRNIRRNIQIIFQDPFASLNPRMIIGDIISEPLNNYRFNRKTIEERVSKVMDLCGLPLSQINRYPHEFSGGQRQRIAIARAIALYPAFILADEPVSSLDVSIQAQIINLLSDLQKELSLTYLFISHDLSVVKHVSDRVAVMYFGSIVEIGSVDEVYSNPSHPYTQALLNSVPLLKPEKLIKRSSVHLKGEMPSPLNPPGGCSFHTRCPLAQFPMCSSKRPALEEKEKDHFVSCHFVT